MATDETERRHCLLTWSANVGMRRNDDLPRDAGVILCQISRNMRGFGIHWVFIAIAIAGCSGDDDDKLCERFSDKVDECMLGFDTSGGCADNPSASVVCAAECLIDSGCSDITGAASNQNPYYTCLAICSGGSAEDFVCADGSGFLSQAGVCDGVTQCPDGSDEADC